MRPDFSIYAVHATCWGVFALTRLALRLSGPAASAPDATVAKEDTAAAPHSGKLIGLHLLAFVVVYFGVGRAIFSDGVPEWFRGQRLVGALLIGTGGVLMSWTLVHFRSWRFRAKVEKGHELAVHGPFALMRNPIYMGMNLFAFGTAIWVPTWIVWLGFTLMCIGSDLRARAEEVVLQRAFGEQYQAYRGRTKRFLPGIY
jgi:protein-S-isoprenylcysteine O-methyltransferase Ste14